MEEHAFTSSCSGYLIKPKDEMLGDLDDINKKNFSVPKELHLTTAVLDHQIDKKVIPVKIELELNACESEKQAASICDADYLVEPKQEILEELEVTDECYSDKDFIVPKDELSNTSLHLDCPDSYQQIDDMATPIKTETMLSKEISELQKNAHTSPQDTETTLCNTGVSAVHIESHVKSNHLVKELRNELLMALLGRFNVINEEPLKGLNDGKISLLTKGSQGSTWIINFIKNGEKQEPPQAEVSLDSRPVIDEQTVAASNSINSCNAGNLEYENVHTSVKRTKTHTREKNKFCEQCSYKCSKSSHLKTHMMTHTGEKPYQCKHCDYKSSKSSALTQHMRTHTGEKPYHCNRCDYKCSMSSALKNHMRTHTGEKPYHCKHCDYKSSTACALKYHTRTHTGEKPYFCEHCDYKTSYSSHLKAHMRTHTGEKPYHCEQCDYKCSKSSYLKTHIRTHTENIFQNRLEEKVDLPILENISQVAEYVEAPPVALQVAPYPPQTKMLLRELETVYGAVELTRLTPLQRSPGPATQLLPDYDCDSQALEELLHSSSTDEDWCIPTGRPKPSDRRSRKKEQNKNAAARYRQKKKAQIGLLLNEEQNLRKRHTELGAKCEHLQREIRYRKGLMRDLFKAKGLIK